MKKEYTIEMAILSLARDSLTDEYGVRNVGTAIYELAKAGQCLADVIKTLQPTDED